MLYLSGCVRRDIPVLITPMMGNRLPDLVTWAADTGCFAAPKKYDDATYLRFLAKNAHALDRCLFATAPDVVGDAVATLARSAPMLSCVRSIGYPVALVAQDGLETLTVPWDEFDALFIGGTTTWKLSEHAARLVRAANERGKWTHMGRVNSLRRLRAAQAMGCKSADGTYLAFGPDVNLPKMQQWLASIERQPLLT